MAESIWNHRPAMQRVGAPPMAYGQPFNHRPLPVYSNSDSGLGPRRAQYGEPFGGRLQSRSIQALNNLDTVPGPEEQTINEKALVLDVHREYGRILSPTNVRLPNLHIFFSLRTLNGSEPLSAITNDLTEIFEVGDQVEIGIEGGFDINGASDECHVILTCSTILQIREKIERPELAPLLIVQEGGEMPLAVTKRCGLVGVHPQVLPNPAVIKAFLENASSISLPQIEWPEFAMVGHSVEGRTVRAPRWLNSALGGTHELEGVALTLQRFGRDVAGFAIIKGHLENGVILTPIDKDDFKVCGEIFFPFEIRRGESGFDYKKVYAIGSKWYFRACRELPGRLFSYRAYSLDDLNGAISRHSETSYAETINVEDDQRAESSVNEIGIQGDTIVDRAEPHVEPLECPILPDSSYGIDRLTVLNNGDLNSASLLVDLSAPETVPQTSTSSAEKAPIISDSTLRLLSEVDFSRPESLLDIDETFNLTQPIVPLQPLREPSILSSSSQSKLTNKCECPVTVIADTHGTIMLDSSSTAGSESCLTSGRSDTIFTELAQPYVLPHVSPPSRSEQTRNDGETPILHSTPPPLVSDTVGVERLGSGVAESSNEQSLSALSVLNKNSGDILSLPTESEVVKKYNVFDESSASTMHFEVLDGPKRTYEEELIGYFEGDELEDPVIMAPSLGVSLLGDSSTTCTPNGKGGGDLVVREEQMKHVEKSAEINHGDVRFVEKNENLADTFWRLEAGDHVPTTTQTYGVKSGTEEENTDRIVCGPYPIRVQRRPDDNDFWFTAKNERQTADNKGTVSKSCSLSSVLSTQHTEAKQCNNTNCKQPQTNECTKENESSLLASGTDVTKDERGMHCNANEESSSALSMVLHSDEVIAKFFIGVIKQQQQ